MTLPQKEVFSLVTEMLRDQIRVMPLCSDPSDTLARALDCVIAQLLGEEEPSRSERRSNGASEPGRVPPGEVGEIYQYLRGLSLTFHNGEPILDRNLRDRRNEGLFYTPKIIVKHIVQGTLAALEPLNLPRLMSLKVLDPAMGTGLFLAEALEQIGSRILEFRCVKPSEFRGLLAQPRERVADLFRISGHAREPDDQTVVRYHVLRNCLFGVDLDPIAVRIAGAVLAKTACGDHAADTDLLRNIRVGNSLIGEGWPSGLNISGPVSDTELRSIADSAHGRIYYRSDNLPPQALAEWIGRQRPFHWPLEFPEVFCPEIPGFDAVIGNPPYEILSAAESGLEERRRQQAYFRKTFSTCHGKINTYRLMLERGLGLLRKGGVLGYIVPKTLLADSTAEKLRKRLLDDSRITEMTIIPEKARAFSGVRQAFLILITVKGVPTTILKPVFWDGSGPTSKNDGVEITRELLVQPGLRVPLVRSQEEKDLLQALLKHPLLQGTQDFPPVAVVNQGEVNLTTHRQFLTTMPTNTPLIRGEHVYPFRVVHPAPQRSRLDWVMDEFFASDRRSGALWCCERLVVGRVVNMDTRRRLKAAHVPVGSLLGDMTNSLTGIAVPSNYLLGLLNSSLLNWRIRLTSTNNYISAAEIQALPIARTTPQQGRLLKPDTRLKALIRDSEMSDGEFLNQTKQFAAVHGPDGRSAFFALLVETLTETLLQEPSESSKLLQRRLDLVVALLYGAEAFSKVFLAATES